MLGRRNFFAQLELDTISAECNDSSAAHACAGRDVKILPDARPEDANEMIRVVPKRRHDRLRLHRQSICGVSLAKVKAWSVLGERLLWRTWQLRQYGKARWFKTEN